MVVEEALEAAMSAAAAGDEDVRVLLKQKLGQTMTRPMQMPDCRQMANWLDRPWFTALLSLTTVCTSYASLLSTSTFASKELTSISATVNISRHITLPLSTIAILRVRKRESPYIFPDLK